MKQSLPDDVRWSLEQCDGYMDLSMWDAATALLSEIPKEHHGHPAVPQLVFDGVVAFEGRAQLRPEVH